MQTSKDITFWARWNLRKRFWLSELFVVVYNVHTEVCLYLMFYFRQVSSATLCTTQRGREPSLVLLFLFSPTSIHTFNGPIPYFTLILWCWSEDLFICTAYFLQHKLISADFVKFGLAFYFTAFRWTLDFVCSCVSLLQRYFLLFRKAVCCFG